jgi:hypothetical protein
MKGLWSENDIEQLKKLYPITGPKELMKIFGRSHKAINSKAKSLRLKKDPEFFNRNPFTEKEIQYLKDHYSDIRSDIIAKKFNRPISSVYNKAYSLGLTKSEEFLASPESGMFIKGSTIGKEFRFKKGHISANKGKKMSPELYKKCKPTMFKKGHLPHNTKQDGEISIRHFNTGSPYFYIRLSLGNWKELHRFLWEKVNEPIPKGYNVVFKDGNQANCEIKNLELISDAELMQRNTLHNYPKDLQNLIQIKGALQRQINKIIENE